MSVMRLISFSRGLNAAHNVVKSMLRWVGLVFGIIPRTGRVSPTVYRAIHYGFIIAVTVVLAIYSPRLVQTRVPIPNWFVQRFYLAIQFVLFYLFVRLLIAAIQLLLAKDVSEFEDIDRAWDVGLDALAREGFDLHWLPVFLVAGATTQQRKSLFDSTRMQWKVTPTDDPAASALAFYACDEAVFICLEDVGALPRQLGKPAISRAVQTGTQSDFGPQATLRPGAIQGAAQQTRRPEQLQTGDKTLAPGAIQQAVAGATMAPPRGARFGETIRPGEVASVVAASAARPVPLEKLSQEELRLARRRLNYFCSKITSERGPYCPINGLLSVLPIRWTQSQSHEPLYSAAAQDVELLHQSLHMQFPVVCLHAGLEDLTGLPQFIERGRELDSRFRDSRAGSRFPAGLAIDDKSSEWAVDRGVTWFRDWIYAEFAKQLANPNNRQLYQFLCTLTERRTRLVRELKTVMGELKLNQPVRLSGYYFAATGDDAARQGFVHGVMQRLMSEQNDVAWSNEWRWRNRRAAALAFGLFLMTMAVLMADAFLGWRIWQHAAAAIRR